jgi:hypothetical protein
MTGKKKDRLDKEMGQETAALGAVGHDLAGGQASPTPKVVCVCCGLLKANPGFKYCFSCHRKWLKVHDDYVSSGFDDETAKKRATRAYPPRY